MKAIQIVSPADGSISARMALEDYVTGLEMLKERRAIKVCFTQDRTSPSKEWQRSSTCVVPQL
jgi:hypothetical protein